MKIVFVILHYLVEEVTSSSINALLNICEGYDADIIIVDNASGNGSGQRLADKYKGHSNVHFIFMPVNEGFARGNNAGYQFAKDKLSPDFIVVMNNDVMIEDTSFIKKIEREYSLSPFAVLGPDIYSPTTGLHQSPIHLAGLSESEILELRERFISRLRNYYFRKLCWKTKLCLGLAHKPSLETAPEQNLHSSSHSGCVLHGACYIFSQKFISKRSVAFNPGTFLYFEEDILHYECLRDELVMRYTPDIKVVHIEDCATRMAFKTEIVREKKQIERMLQSIDVLIKIIHDDNCE